MKLNYFFSLIVVVTALLFYGCESDTNNNDAPQLPPFSSMAIDFSSLTAEAKVGQTEVSKRNFAVAGITVLAWNSVLASTLAVPVKAFYHSFEHPAVYLGERTWLWAYSIAVMGQTFNARLTGTIRDVDVKWEMYIARGGLSPGSEFLWFEGTSALDRASGQWRLYHSPGLPGEVLRIDWIKEGDRIGEVKYTYMLETNTDRVDQLTVGSNLTHGLTGERFNAFYNVVYNTRDRVGLPDISVNIEWSTSARDGRIKSPHFFQDSNWRCWDTSQRDAVCN